MPAFCVRWYTIEGSMTEHAKSLLVVEDDKFLRDLLVRKLEREGFDVQTAIDGNEGLDKISRMNPDLVLLDLILPGIDGFEVLERLRERSAGGTLPPVLILSNLGQKDDVERGMALGARDYMVKAHFTPSDIVVKIHEILGGASDS